MFVTAAQFLWAAHACPLEPFDQPIELNSILSDYNSTAVDMELNDHDDAVFDHDVEHCDLCSATIVALSQMIQMSALSFQSSNAVAAQVLLLGTPDRLQTRPPILPAS
jgi:hypothetical protein